MPPIKNPLLHAYWIEFEPSPDAGEGFMTISSAGIVRREPRVVGVTAFTLEDALFITDHDLLAGAQRAPIRRVVEDVEVTQLPELALQVGLPSWLPESDARLATTLFRGIWFPFRGYRHSRP